MIPPSKYLKHAGCHWVERLNGDGFGMGLEVYQWQPSSKKWCRPNEYDTYGMEVDLSGYKWIAECPYPELEP